MKRFVCVKQQSPTDCGAACLATVARHHGLKLPLARIRQLTGTDQRGTSAYGIVTAAEKLGFRAKGVKAAKQHLTKDLALPCIAHVIKGQLQHYLVIHHISRGKLVIADPARGVVICSIEEFVKIWSGVLILLVPTGQFQKRDETKSLFSRLYPLLRPYRGILVQIFIASLLYSIFGILGAFYLKVLADHVLVEGMARTLHVLSIGFGLLAVLRVIIGALRNQLLIYASTKLEAKLVLQFYQHVLEMPVSYFDSYKVGEILARVSDTGKIRNAISHAVVSVMLDTVMVIVVGIVLLLQNRALFMVTLLLAPLLLLLFALFTGPYRAVQRRYMEQAAKLEAALVETLGGISLIKAHTAEQEVQRQTESKFNRVLAAALKDARLRNLQGSLHSGMTLIAQLLILWIGGMEILRGAISIGQLLTYNALLSYFLTPITNLAGLQPVLQEARVAAERLWETLELERESLFAVHKISLPHAFGGLRFENVSFRYGTRRLVLRDVNFTVAPGEKVAIVGPSGSGKTTIARLVLGFYQPEQGQILFGRFRLEDLNLCEVRSRIGYVAQDCQLFSGTLLDNLVLGLREFEMEQIMALAEQLGIDAMINQLPERFLTMVGERGVNLSGGQKQQIALLRALIRRPEVLILDEATSHLDSIIEQEIQKAVYGIGSSMTIIVIAHRLSTITNCDKIVVLDGGQVTEIGTHSQLLDSYGTYYRLWQAQNGYREVCCVEH
jgi:ATP-binding cassette subfamily B protein